jgi:hypothetical protein
VTGLSETHGHCHPWHLAPAVPNSGDIALVALRRIQEVTFDKRAG